MSRARASIRNRENILRAALELFSKKGYNGTSIDAIATKVGITKGAIYWHFKDKLALYDAVDSYSSEQWDKKVTKPISKISDPKRKLKSLIENTFDFCQKNPMIFDFMMTFLEGPLALQSRMRKKVIGSYAGERAIIAGIISDGIKQRQFKNVDPMTFAAFLVGATDGILIQWSLDRSSVDLDRGASIILRVLFEGLEMDSRQ
jgi:AcrR family transcriptional regulator